LSSSSRHSFKRCSSPASSMLDKSHSSQCWCNCWCNTSKCWWIQR
ncbi:hypothetical protein D030_0589B, partial [Vibrio parahaemolyticus AQ3810]